MSLWPLVELKERGIFKVEMPYVSFLSKIAQIGRFKVNATFRLTDQRLSQIDVGILMY